MSSHKNDFINAEDFIALKDKINAELSRRNISASVNQMSLKPLTELPYIFLTTPNQNQSITEEYVKKTINLLADTMDTDLDKLYKNDYIVNFDEVYNLINKISQYQQTEGYDFSNDKRIDTSGCKAICMGLCNGACYGLCNGCSGCTGSKN